MISSEDLSKIQGRLLALVKQIYLKKPPNNKTASKASFFAGEEPTLPGSAILEWWITEQGMVFFREISEMIANFDSRFSPNDADSVRKIINSVLQQNALNDKIFNSDKVTLLLQTETLFEARSTENVEDFCSYLWQAVDAKLENSINHWLIVYPLHKIFSSSFDLGFDRIQILNSDDFEKWKELTQIYPSLASFNQVNGSVNDSQGFSPSLGKIPSWILCNASRTESGARKEAERLIRTFLAVLFSHLENKQMQNRSISLLAKSMATPWRDSIQFSRPPASKSTIRSPIGVLLPPLLGEANISPEDVSSVKDLYIQRTACPDSIVKKMITASHFIHYAIIHDDLERFLHFFFALDAMFGERFKVEEKILEGVKKVFPRDKTWKQRTEWLFDLRSELVHGGASQISDWKGFAKYRSHFKSHPLDDVKVVAMTGASQSCKNRLG